MAALLQSCGNGQYINRRKQLYWCRIFEEHPECLFENQFRELSIQGSNWLCTDDHAAEIFRNSDSLSDLLQRWNELWLTRQMTFYHDWFAKNQAGNLTEEQRRIVVHPDQRLLVVAGAGTGKTTTILHKIAFTVARHRLPARSILVLAFNRSVRHEIKNRLHGESRAVVDVHTFHSLALQLTGCRGKVLNELEDNNVRAEALQLVLQEKYRSRTSFPRKVRKKIERIHNNYDPVWWQSCVDRFGYMSETEAMEKGTKLGHRNFSDAIAGESYKRYLYLLEQKASTTLAAMVRQATAKLQNHASGYQGNYQYIFVDEFQDVSLARVGFIQALLAVHSSARLCCVGDDWQSIYRFAGASPSFMYNFKDYFGEPSQLYLTRTHRFDTHTAAISQDFVLKNPYQIKKGIKARDRVQGGSIWAVEIDSHQYQDGTKMINKILEFISEKVAQSQQQKSAQITLGILARYNKTLFVLESALSMLASIPEYLEIFFYSCHRAKGKEFDYCVVLDLHTGDTGFPSRDTSTEFPNAEERRLFYVAITRAKLGTALLYPRKAQSIFVREVRRLLGNN